MAEIIKTISKTDYNTIQSKVGSVLGGSSTSNSTFGWGQIVQSSPVDESNKVGATEWNNLRNDIINAWIHINNLTPSLPSAVIYNTIRGNDLDAPYSYYDTFATQIVTNRFVVNANQSVVSLQGSAETLWPGPYGTIWNTRIFSTVLVTWPSAKEAREFFNSGSEIRFTSSRTGGRNLSQNTSWTNLLNSAGTRGFGGNIPGAGISPINGQNFYRLRNVYDIWYSISGSGAYSSNIYRISARSPSVTDNSTGTATSVEFLIEWVDNYTDPGSPAPGDEVDGTVNLTVSTLTPIGSLVPAGTGNFTIVSPTVTITSPRP